ncbi:MAG: mannose-1-phosphate guanylyltransferase [bacterium]
MDYALIIAGGSGTRLWPMSTRDTPKQLIPFIDGKSLLQLAVERLQRLLPDERIYVCAGEGHREAILGHVPSLAADRFIAEPEGRDTLNAVGLGTGVLGRDDPEAVVGVFTADHLIEPADRFAAIVRQGYALAEARAQALVTFGVEPTHAATGYGYLQLDAPLEGANAFRVAQFKEKPDADTAQQYLEAGPHCYLWNSGMFVWRAATLMRCIERFAPENYAGLQRCIEAWRTPRWDEVLRQVYPTLRKISVDYAVMEPATGEQAGDGEVEVVAVPLAVRWLDVGSWPSFAQTRASDEAGNCAAGCHTLMLDTRNTLAASSHDGHLIAAIGVEDLIVIHTPRATLVCRADQAERIKELHKQLGEDWV